VGRQIQFYMLPEDQAAFLRFAQEHDPVVLVATLDRQGPAVRPVEDTGSVRNPMFCLWNRALLPHLQRKSIGDADRRCYTIDSLHLPVLEFDPCITTEWEGRPALVQGRLYGQFDPWLKKPPEFEKWYESLVRWIRKNYKKNPAGFGGYVGPAAYRFFLDGGYLLPNFRPPRTDVWLAEIGKQHQTASS
jgi:hypothetical protein